MRSKKSIFRFNLIIVSLFFILSHLGSTQQDNIDISDYDDQNNQRDSQHYQQQQYKNNENDQRQMQYMSQRRSACLVLSRYYLNQFGEQVNGIIKDLMPEDQNKFINKLYATAVEKCQPIITQNEVMEFFTGSNQNFNPSHLFYIFDGYNFYEVGLKLDQITPNQKSIIKFIKQFDAEMQVRKEEQQAQKMEQQRDDGIEVFFISMKNLPPQIKYFYIVIVILISGAILWYGFSQLQAKPAKKSNKKKKKQE